MQARRANAPNGHPAAAPEEARQRLLHAALQLFADQGFAKTSTRELAEAAQVNVAAISYYFGDKAGLYRAAYFAQHARPEDDLARFTSPALTLAQALRGFYESFLQSLRQGEEARLCMKLQMREMLEPTGLWQEEIERGIRPVHHALLGLLCRHLGLKAPDADLQRLAVCLEALGVHLHVGREVTDGIAPGLNAGPQALDLWADRLVMFALAMVQAEAQRRLKPEAVRAKGRK